MKSNAKSTICQVLEWLALIAPAGGYSIYSYYMTLQYTMSDSAKGGFWSLIALTILGAVLYNIFKKKYERYVQGYVQQKTDLETNPQNELLIKKVAEKSEIIENIDWVIVIIPLLLTLTVLKAFQNSLEQLILIFEIIIASLCGKVGLHSLTIYFKKSGMMDNISDNNK
jgi:hypothetical protein